MHIPVRIVGSCRRVPRTWCRGLGKPGRTRTDLRVRRPLGQPEGSLLVCRTILGEQDSRDWVLKDCQGGWRNLDCPRVPQGPSCPQEPCGVKVVLPGHIIFWGPLELGCGLDPWVTS